jgi:hypothetical protein
MSLSISLKYRMATPVSFKRLGSLRACAVEKYAAGIRRKLPAALAT